MKFLLTVLVMFLTLTANAEAYMIIADVHTGSEKVRTNSNGSKVYPKKGLKTFESALKQAIKRGERVVLSLGDETNRRTTKYEKKMLKIARKYKQLTIIYTRGNHNPDNSVLTPTPYYFRDIDGKRIVSLNTTDTKDDRAGGVSKTQIDWLKEVIKDRQVIVISHHPIYGDESCNTLPQFQALKEILDSPNVEQVFSGHLHLRRDCGKYKVFPALTLKGWSIL